jgi:Holliday junction DNA helicase RuvA
MIAYLEGTITALDATSAIIDVGGVGYHVRISLLTWQRLKDITTKTKVYTWLQVKEDSHTLYGFVEPQEKNLFLHLVSVTGIGANTALIMLSSMPAADLQYAIVHEDLRSLSSIKGIGAKTAQRVVLELKDKLMKDPATLSVGTLPTASVNHNTQRDEALIALVTLGYVRNVAEKALDAIIKNGGGETFTTEDLIRKVLRSA